MDGYTGKVKSTTDNKEARVFCVQEIILPTTTSTTATSTTSKKALHMPGFVWDMSKVPKESIGIVNSCTLYTHTHFKTWTTLNGEKFCGVENMDHMDRSTADKFCKAKVTFFLKRWV